MNRQTFSIAPELVEGIALVLDIPKDEVESEDIETIIILQLGAVRDRCHNKAEAIQAILRTQYVPYNPDEEHNETE